MHAVGKVRSLRPDFVLVDLHLPDSDGLAITYMLKQRAPDSLVVVMIGLPAYHTLARAAGAFDTVLKDQMYTSLIETLLRVCARAKLL